MNGMKRNSWLTLLALVVVLGGLMWYVSGASGGGASGSVSTTTVSSIPVTGPYVEHGQYYDIAANYPTTTPMRGNAGQAALERIRSFIQNQIAQFKAQGNFANLTPQDIKMMGYASGKKESLDIAYLISTSPAGTPRTVSYIFTIYEDTLGAHGNTFFRTFTFDLKTGQELSIGDLFAPGQPYLATLSSLTRTNLTQNLGPNTNPQMLDSGTAPDEKNFQNFFLDNGTLAILFAPYDVAPYAAGPQTVRIPFSDLAGLLQPQYR